MLRGSRLLELGAKTLPVWIMTAPLARTVFGGVRQTHRLAWVRVRVGLASPSRTLTRTEPEPEPHQVSGKSKYGMPIFLPNGNPNPHQP